MVIFAGPINGINQISRNTEVKFSAVKFLEKSTKNYKKEWHDKKS